MHQGIFPRDHDSAVIPLRGRTLPEVAAAPVDLDDLNSPHTLAVLSVPPGATVLDIGCGSGTVARALDARGCRVYGVDIDPKTADMARRHCVDVVLGDVETITLSSAFDGLAFDVVLCLDVLEHLRDPAATLVQAAALLAAGGSMLISVPNITHGALRLELLSGRFRYRDSGLLDRGHLRFFDSQGVDDLIRQSGLRAETTLRVIRRLDQTEFDVDLANIPDALRASLENDIDALTYQFFIIARPARALQSVKTGTSLLEQQRERIDQLSAELEKGGAYTRHVEQELAAKDGHLRELERLVEDAARTLAAKDGRLAEIEQVMADMTRLSDDTTAYVQHLEGELQKRAGDLAIRDDEMSVLRVHIERAERAIAERDALLQAAGEREALLRSAERDREARLQAADREREALVETASRTARENRELTAHFTWVLRQPRHRLAERAANTLKRSTLLHRVLRPIVLAALKESPTSPGSPSPWP